jgi:hypothetical protein
VLPGGENYKEEVLTLPEKEATPLTKAEQSELRQIGKMKYGERILSGIQERYQNLLDRSMGTDPTTYKSPHWDEPNVLAHVRFTDRMVGNLKTLFLEEVQSDWHQAGRKYGYRGDPVNTKKDYKRLSGIYSFSYGKSSSWERRKTYTS